MKLIGLIRVGLPVIMAISLFGCASSNSPDADGTSEKAGGALTHPGFSISSPNFSNVRPKKRIPVENTCYGDNLSPPLSWTGAPDRTQSYALITQDVDNKAGPWVHWVIYNIPVDVTELPEGIVTTTQILPDGTTQGINDERIQGYMGPCPPANIISYSRGGGENYEFGEPPHHYHFTLYALDSVLEIGLGATKTDLVKAMEDRILAEASTVGKYTTPLGLSGKEGGGFLKTATGKKSDLSDSVTKKELHKTMVQSGQAQQGTTGKQIYNSMGDPITPTPAAGK